MAINLIEPISPWAWVRTVRLQTRLPSRGSLSAKVPLSELFAASYRHGGYEKKYRRCLSRVHELLRETEARETGAR